MDHDSRSSIPSSYRKPVQQRQRAFDSNFYFDEHTKRRGSSMNKTEPFSASEQLRHHDSGYYKQSVRHSTPTKVFQGVLFNIPEIRDDLPQKNKTDQSQQYDDHSSVIDSPLHLNPIQPEPSEENYLSQSQPCRSQHTIYNAERDTIKVDSSTMGEKKKQRYDSPPKDENVCYWTTVAVKVAQAIVMNGGMPHHAEEAQMIILDCARDKNLSIRKDGSTIIASKLSTSLLKLGANEHIVAKAVTMFLKCISTVDISVIQGFYVSPSESKINHNMKSGSSFIEMGCEMGSAFVSSATELLRSACAPALKETPTRSSYYSSSTMNESWEDNESSYASNSLRRHR